ncbi:MAG: hypothetical protein GY757_38960 [bacterium]|nr:hypothetical protein [bacterium]
MSNQEHQQEATQEPGRRTRRKARNTIDHQYRRYWLNIEASTGDEQLMHYAAQFGYTQEKIAEGKTLLDELSSALNFQKDKKATFRTAFSHFQKKKLKADNTAIRFMQLARFVFKEDPVSIELLELQGRRKRSFSERVEQNKQFYKKLLSTPELLEKMNQYNISAETLQAGLQEVEEIIAADAAQEKAKADVQIATEEKDKVLKKMKHWMNTYLKVMKIALQDVPQQKEKLGIVTA